MPDKLEALHKIDKWKYFAKIGYEPHPRQRLFHDSGARFKVAASGRRIGKTTMGAREVEPILLTPHRRVWLCGPTYDLGEKEFRIIWNDMIVKLGLGQVKDVKRSYAKKQGDLSIEFPWKTRVEVRSADRPENLVGEGLDYVIMCEAAKHEEETWNRFIRPALSDRHGGACFPSTPEGQNWFYYLWKEGRDPGKPEVESWQFPSWDNPYVYPRGRDDPEILLIERTTPKEIFDQEYGADFTSFSGKVYTEWDEGTHVQHVPYNPLLPNYISFDWGFAAPMAAVEFQVDSFQRVRIWREHYKSRTRLKDFLQELKDRPQPVGYHLNLCFGDAADPEAVESVSQEFFPCYADPLAKENKREGIELVQGFLKKQQVSEDDYGAPVEEPWLIVDHGCKNIIHEFNNYRVAEAVRGKDPREDTYRRDDHALDALRYGLMHIFKLGATSRLSDFSGGSSSAADRGFITTGTVFS